MAPTLFLHIGAHKTGTTYIQEALCALEDSLLSAHNVLYLRSGRVAWGHHGLAASCLHNRDVEDLRQAIAAEISAHEGDVLLSSENFEMLSDEGVATLLSCFPGYQPRVFFMFRSWGSLLYSLWQEAVKHGSARTYSAYCLPHIAFPHESSSLNFSLVLDRWFNAVGRENVALASYDAARATGEDVCALLLRWMGVVDIAPKPTLQNQAFEPRIVETLRALNYLAKFDGRPESMAVRAAFFEIAHRHADAIRELHAIMGEHLMDTVDFNDMAAAKEYFAAFLAEHDALMIDDREARLAHAVEPQTPPKVVDLGYAFEPQASSVLRELSAAVAAHIDADG